MTMGGGFDWQGAASAADAAAHAAGGKAATTADKAANVAKDAAAGAAIGGAIGTVIPGVGNVIGGAVGSVAGAVYGAVDQFGGDVADFVTGVFGGGDSNKEGVGWCLDFFRQKTSCDDIDLRMNNVVSMQRDLRADPTLLSMNTDDAAKRWTVDPAYADRLLTLERARYRQLDINEKGLDHILHARPDFILGRAPLFGVTVHGVDDIVKRFAVRPEFAQQILNAAPKLLKPKPPPPKKIGAFGISGMSLRDLLLPVPGAPPPPPPPPPPPDAPPVVATVNPGDVPWNGGAVLSALSPADRAAIRAKNRAKWLYGAAPSGRPLNTGAVQSIATGYAPDPRAPRPCRCPR